MLRYFSPAVFVYLLLLVKLEATTTVECHLDPKINAETWTSYITEVGFVFESACGRNRGIFVTNPADGHTYNCAKFPEIWNVTDANGIKKVHDPAHAVEVLDNFVSSVYLSSPKYIRDKDPAACDMEAMTALTCGRENPWKTAPWASKINNQPIRGVNLGGLFILKSWMLTGFIDWGEESTTGITDHLTFSKKCAAHNLCDKLTDHLATFYTQDDFDSMKSHGLNTVRIPVGFWYFKEISQVPSDTYEAVLPQESIYDISHPLTKVITMIKQSGLQAIITLASITDYDLDSIHASTSPSYSDGSKSVTTNTEKVLDTAAATVATAEAMASYIDRISTNFDLDNVMMLEINTPPAAHIFDSDGDKGTVEKSIQKIRLIQPSVPILLLESSVLPNPKHSTTTSEDANSLLYLNTKVYHGIAVQDIASDTPAADREKMYAHEKIACGFKAPLHFTTCMRRPTLVGEFSLAIDDCIMKDTDTDFQDYGQCSNLSERANSNWWHQHTRSFAMRQIDTYERELGWAFYSYKLDAATEASNPSAVYWSFSLAVAAGLIDLTATGVADTEVTAGACAHKPESDYMMGDATYPPSTQQPIYYWIPPNPTLDPTAEPVIITPSSSSSLFDLSTMRGMIDTLVVALLGLLIVLYACYSFCRRATSTAARGGYSELTQLHQQQHSSSSHA